MISQFYILSLRGDIIVNRDYRQDLVKNTHEIFYRQVKLQKECPPIFNIEGINYGYIKRQGLYIVATTRFDGSPSLILEVLQKSVKIIQDFLGSMTEESIRKNFILIYEILDECMDFGTPQLMQSDLIKPYIVNDPIQVEKQSQEFLQMPKTKFGNFNIFSKSTTSSSSNKRSVKDESKDNEIFVDIFEKISVLFNSSGYVINSSIEGCVQMKSYLKGNPGIKLALNEDLQIGRGAINSNVVLDDCNFHNCVNTNDFEMSKILRIQPPDGEFVAMNYRVTSEFSAPFRVFPYIEEVSQYKLELSLKIKACFPKEVTASYLNVNFPLPKLISNVHNEITGKTMQNQKVDVKKNEDGEGQFVEWQIKKFQGGTEQILKTKISLQTNANTYNSRKEIGPISISFEIPMYNVSNLAIKYLRIEEKEKKYNPYRWVRYITQSSSYVCRT